MFCDVVLKALSDVTIIVFKNFGPKHSRRYLENVNYHSSHNKYNIVMIILVKIWFSLFFEIVKTRMITIFLHIALNAILSRTYLSSQAEMLPPIKALLFSLENSKLLFIT